MTQHGGLTPEQRARIVIDKNLELAGWIVQNRNHINLGAGPGIAVREVPMGDEGYADYLLYVDAKIVGVLEAKKDGITLAEVHAQALRYAENLTPGQRGNAIIVNGRLPFIYEATAQDMRDVAEPGTAKMSDLGSNLKPKRRALCFDF